MPPIYGHTELLPSAQEVLWADTLCLVFSSSVFSRPDKTFPISDLPYFYTRNTFHNSTETSSEQLLW